MFYLCSGAATDTSAALTGEGTTALRHKYSRGKSSVSKVTKSQLTTDWFVIPGWKKCHIFLPASKPCALKPTSLKWHFQKGKQLVDLPAFDSFHAFLWEGRQSPQSSYENLARESTSHTPGLRQTSLPHSSKNQAQCETAWELFELV